MYDLARNCFLCLNQDSNNLRSVFDSDHINPSINFTLKFVLPEIELFHPEYPALVCNACFMSLTSYQQFKSNCIKVNQYIKTNLYRLQKHYNGPSSQNIQPTYNRPQLNDNRNVQTSRSEAKEAINNLTHENRPTQNISHRAQIDRQIIETQNNFKTHNTNVRNENRPTQNIPDVAQKINARYIQITQKRNNTNIANETPSYYNRGHSNLENINSRTQISTEGSNNFKTQNTNITNNENRKTQNLPPPYNRAQRNVEGSKNFVSQNTNVANENRQTQNLPPAYNRVHSNIDINSRTNISTDARTHNTNLAEEVRQNTAIQYKTNASNNKTQTITEDVRNNMTNTVTQSNVVQVNTSIQYQNGRTNLTAQNTKTITQSNVVQVNTSIRYQNERTNLTTQNTKLSNETMRNTAAQNISVQKVNAPKNNIHFQDGRSDFSTQNPNLLIENRQQNSNPQENSIQQGNATNNDKFYHTTWGQNPSGPYNQFQNIVPQNPPSYSNNRTTRILQEKLNAHTAIQTAPSIQNNNTHRSSINSEEVIQSVDRRTYQNNPAISNNVQVNANYNAQLLRAPPPYRFNTENNVYSTHQSGIKTVRNDNYMPQTRTNPVHQSHNQEISTSNNAPHNGLQSIPSVFQNISPINEPTNKNCTVQVHQNNVLQSNPNNTLAKEQQNGGTQIHTQTEPKNIRRPSSDLSPNAKRQKVITENNNHQNHSKSTNNTVNTKAKLNDHSIKETSHDSTLKEQTNSITTQSSTNIVTHNKQTYSNSTNVSRQTQPPTDIRANNLTSNNLKSVNEKIQSSENTSTEVTNTTKNYNLRQNTQISYSEFFDNEETNINTDKQTNNDALASKTVTPQIDNDEGQQNDTVQTLLFSTDLELLDIKQESGSVINNEPRNVELLFDNISSHAHHKKFVEMMFRNQCIKNYVLKKFIDKPKPYPDDQINCSKTEQVQSILELLRNGKRIPPNENLSKSNEGFLNTANMKQNIEPSNQQIKTTNIQPKDKQVAAKENIENQENFEDRKFDLQLLHTTNINQITEPKKDTNDRQIMKLITQSTNGQPLVKKDIDIEVNFEENKNDRKLYQELLDTDIQQNTEHEKGTNDQPTKTTKLSLVNGNKNFNQEVLGTSNITQNTESEKGVNKQQMKSSNTEQETEQPSIKEEIYIKENIVAFNDTDHNLYNSILTQTEINTIKSEPNDYFDVPTVDNTVPPNENVSIQNVPNDDADIKEELLTYTETDIKFYQDLIDESESNSMINDESNENSEDGIIDLTETTEEDGLIKCKVCQIELPKRIMYFHSQIHGGLECSQCKKRFTSNYHLERHMKCIHDVKADYKCGECNKTFVFRKFYENHLKIHGDAENRPHECSICQKRFLYLPGLKNHMLNHASEENRTEQCPQCDKKFFTTAHLKYHLKVHSREKKVNFDCEICGKHFVRYVNLFQHQLIHKGVKKWECKICHKKFLHNSHLKQHIPTHGGDKEFKCSKCDKSFSYKCSLEKHMTVHENTKSRRKKKNT